MLMELPAEKLGGDEQVALPVPGTTGTTPRSSPGDWGSRSALPPRVCPPPSRCPQALDSCGHWAAVQGRRVAQGSAEPPPGPAAAAPPRSRPRPKGARKANKDVLVSALLEAQEGGNQCLVNGKRENRSGKTVYFQAGEWFVHSTGHCGGSPAGHQTPQAEECALSEPGTLTALAGLRSQVSSF